MRKPRFRNSRAGIKTNVESEWTEVLRLCLKVHHLRQQSDNRHTGPHVLCAGCHPRGCVVQVCVTWARPGTLGACRGPRPGALRDSAGQGSTLRCACSGFPAPGTYLQGALLRGLWAPPPCVAQPGTAWEELEGQVQRV